MNNPRRLFLSVALKLLLLLGLGLLLYPFIASLRTDSEGSADTGPGRVVDLEHLTRGQIKSIEVYGRPVWILRRSPTVVAQLGTAVAELRDADSQFSQQPAAARNPHRSLSGEFFVFLPLESKRQCQVSWHASVQGGGEFTEPCYHARFDAAGRILKGTGVAEQQNLTVPDYEMVSATQIRLLPPR